jgi:hypothetical protein
MFIERIKWWLMFDSAGVAGFLNWFVFYKHVMPPASIHPAPITDYRLPLTDYLPQLMPVKHIMRMIMPVRFLPVLMHMLMDKVHTDEKFLIVEYLQSCTCFYDRMFV